MMKIEVISGRDIDHVLAKQWEAIQQSDARLGSPFLCWQYIHAAAAERDDVYVGLMHEGDGTPVGMLPFQRHGRSGRPVGGPLSDCQAVIVHPQREWSARDMVTACGMDVLDFDRLLSFQQPLQPFHVRLDRSPQLDLSRGFAAYVAERNRSGTNQIKQIQSKCRKLQREVGKVTFCVHTDDAFVVRRLRRWKSRQYKQTRVVDVFAFKWIVSLLERIAAVQQPGFAGMVSSLHADGRLVAAHLGMRSGRVWHWWFPTYSPRYAAYTPGLILLLKMAQAAPELGIDTIDLGNGDERYKARVASRSVEIARGWVRASTMRSVAGGIHRRAMELARTSGLASMARLPEQAIRMRRFH